MGFFNHHSPAVEFFDTYDKLIPCYDIEPVEKITDAVRSVILVVLDSTKFPHSILINSCFSRLTNEDYSLHGLSRQYARISALLLPLLTLQ
jgi:hypothetical protein